MKILRTTVTGETVSLRLEAGDTLEEMAAQAPMRMDELAARIEDIIQGGVDNEAREAVREDAVEAYKRYLVAWLSDWAEEEETSTRGAFLKPAPLLRRIVEKIEKDEP